MSPLLTFIIPVRHQSNCQNWSALKENLTQTIASIAAQTNPLWSAVIVANEGAALPTLPHGFEVVRVKFPPNSMYDINGDDREAIYDSLRLDKGRRVLKGMLHVRDTKFYMVVDDDDFVSHSIVDYISRNINSNGWKIDEGYVWGHGSKMLYVHHDFSNFCGTSLIIRSDLYKLPDAFEFASNDYIKSMLGSHVKIAKILANESTPLSALPFRGAVYRIGHMGAHSKSPGIIKSFFLNKFILRRPPLLLRNLFNLRMVNKRFIKEYFGGFNKKHPKVAQ